MRDSEETPFLFSLVSGFPMQYTASLAMDVGFLGVLPGPSFGRAVDSETFEQEVKAEERFSPMLVTGLEDFQIIFNLLRDPGTSAPAF